MTRLVWILPFVVACASKSPPPQAPKQAAIDCNVVAEHGIGDETSSPSLAAKVKVAVAASCARNAWSEETKRCIVDSPAAHDCTQLLTDAQTAALKSDLQAAFADQHDVTVQTVSSPTP